MPFIVLSTGQTTRVDKRDYERLRLHKWTVRKSGVQRVTYYAQRSGPRDANGNRATIVMHRVIMNAPRHMEVDHINGDGLDNRRCNLRLCLHKSNCRNSRYSRVPESGHRGITRNGAKWKALIHANGKRIYLGTFAESALAAAAYNKALRKVHGKYAVTKKGNS